VSHHKLEVTNGWLLGISQRPVGVGQARCAPLGWRLLGHPFVLLLDGRVTITCIVALAQLVGTLTRCWHSSGLLVLFRMCRLSCFRLPLLGANQPSGSRSQHSRTDTKHKVNYRRDREVPTLGLAERGRPRIRRIAHQRAHVPDGHDPDGIPLGYRKTNNVNT